MVAFAERVPHKTPLKALTTLILALHHHHGYGENYFELTIPISFDCTQYLMWYNQFSSQCH